MTLLPFFALLAGWALIPAEAFDYHRGCFFSRWTHDRGMTGDKEIEQVYVPGTCSHIYYSYIFMHFDDFSIKILDPEMELGENGLVERVVGLKKVDPDLTVMVSLCEWEYTDPDHRHFAKMLPDPKYRKTLIKNLVKFVKDWGFDGIDVDWEFPLTYEEGQQFAVFIRELREEIGPDMLFTISVSAFNDLVEEAYDVEAINEVADLIHVMTFENSFPDTYHNTRLAAALYPPTDPTTPAWLSVNAEESIQFWIDRGVPPRKLTLGIPTYWEGWTLADPADNGPGAPAIGLSEPREVIKEKGFSAFLHLCNYPADLRVQLGERGTDYVVVDNDQWFAGDSYSTIIHKLEWVKAQGLGGAYIWLLDYDDWKGDCPESEGELWPVMRAFKQHLVD